MSFTLRKAIRSDSIPLIGIQGKSGTGKTFTALLMARGIVGPKGRIGMIDTERGRGSLYADQIPGGYEVGELDRFSPGDYIEAINAIERADIDILIIDSASHEWEGEGGVRDMAAKSEQKRGIGIHNWIQPKAQHTKFVQRLLRTKIPVIVCMRGKQLTKQKKVNGKTEVVKDDYTSPIQDSDFIFEMTAYMEILPDHSIDLTKWSHPDLKGCFPTKGPVTIETGEKIAAWAEGTKKPAAKKKAPAKAKTTPKKEAANASKEETAPSSVLVEAEEAAGRGTEALRKWWTGAGKPHQNELASHLKALKATAAEQDGGLSVPSLIEDISKIASPHQQEVFEAKFAEAINELEGADRNKVMDALADIQYTDDLETA